jgi:hypothetical protein
MRWRINRGWRINPSTANHSAIFDLNDIRIESSNQIVSFAELWYVFAAIIWIDDSDRTIAGWLHRTQFAIVTGWRYSEEIEWCPSKSWSATLRSSVYSHLETSISHFSVICFLSLVNFRVFGSGKRPVWTALKTWLHKPFNCGWCHPLSRRGSAGLPTVPIEFSLEIALTIQSVNQTEWGIARPSESPSNFKVSFQIGSTAPPPPWLVGLSVILKWVEPLILACGDWPFGMIILACHCWNCSVY